MHYVALFGFFFKIIGKILQLYATIKYICTITIKKPNNYEKIKCISVFHHTAVILAITSLSNIFSPKYLLFNLYTNSSR